MPEELIEELKGQLKELKRLTGEIEKTESKGKKVSKHLKGVKREMEERISVMEGNMNKKLVYSTIANQGEIFFQSTG